MGGKGASPSNNQQVQFEMQQAQEARDKEAARQARLTRGKSQIDQLFKGTPVTAKQQVTFDPKSLSGFTPGGPASTTPGAGDTASANQPTKFDWQPNDVTGGQFYDVGDTGLKERQVTFNTQSGNMYPGSTAYELYAPLDNGQYHYLGANPDWNTLAQSAAGTQYNKDAPTGEYKDGKFDDAFYNKYRQGYLDYANPQVARQYNAAKDDAAFGFARAGTIGSKAYNEALQKIDLTQKDAATAVQQQAEQQTAGVRQQIAGEQQTALNQLYSTEDPDVAANTATSSVNQSLQAVPNLSPLGDLFKPLVIGASQGYAGYNAAQGFGTGFNARPPNYNSGSYNPG